MHLRTLVGVVAQPVSATVLGQLMRCACAASRWRSPTTLAGSQRRAAAWLPADESFIGRAGRGRSGNTDDIVLAQVCEPFPAQRGLCGQETAPPDRRFDGEARYVSIDAHWAHRGFSEHRAKRCGFRLGDERVAGRGIDDRTGGGRRLADEPPASASCKRSESIIAIVPVVLGASTTLSVAMSGSMWLALRRPVTSSIRSVDRRASGLVGPAEVEHEIGAAVANEAALPLGEQVPDDHRDEVGTELVRAFVAPRPVYSLMQPPDMVGDRQSRRTGCGRIEGGAGHRQRRSRLHHEGRVARKKADG